MRRAIQVEDLDPAKARDELRSSLRDLSQLVTFAMCVIAEGRGVRKVDRLSELAFTIQTIGIMMQGVATSIASILRLTEVIDASMRDCYGIARSICEGAVNVTYILAGGDEAAGRARRHAMQKSYRDLARVKDVAGFQVSSSGLPPPHAIPGMPEALAEFTRRNGSEITEWSGLGLLERRDAIVRRYPDLELALTGSIDGLYRTASELLHGTFAGAELFWTAGGPTPPSEAEFETVWLQHHLVAVHTCVWTAVLPMVEAVELEFDVPELGRMRARWLRDLRSIFEITVTPIPDTGAEA